jgi:Meiotically up-regulated gene 113
MTGASLENFQSTDQWRERSGSIYILQVENKGPIKVGFTQNDPAKRALAIQQASPYELSLLATFPASASEELELHRKLEPHRLRNEWYRPSEEVVSTLAACCPSLREKGPVHREPSVERCMSIFGGLDGVAKICGITISAVCHWRKSIPGRHHRKLVQYAKANGLQYGFDDLYAEEKAA